MNPANPTACRTVDAAWRAKMIKLRKADPCGGWGVGGLSQVPGMTGEAPVVIFYSTLPVNFVG